MTLSAVVQQEIDVLKVYYKSLYFVRFFLPQKIRIALQDLDVARRNDLQNTVFNLSASFLKPTWFERFIIGFFPGLAAFQNGPFMCHMRLLSEKNMFSKFYFNMMMISSDSLEDIYHGLVLFQETGIDPKVEPDYRWLNQVVLHIVRVMKLDILPENKKTIYKDIAKHKLPSDFSEAIYLLAEKNLIKRPLYKELLASYHPSAFAQAAVLLKENDLLCLSEQPIERPDELFVDRDVEKEVLKQRILEVVKEKITGYEGYHCPRFSDLSVYSFVMAVTDLQKQQLLTTDVLNALIASPDPMQLSNVLVKFYANDKLSMTMLPKFEKHITNLNIMEKIDIQQSDRFFDFEYCEYYATLLSKRSRTPLFGDIYLTFFEDRYDTFQQAGQLDVLLKESDVLYTKHLFGHPALHTAYYSFLKKAHPELFSCFVTILLILNKDAEFVSENVQFIPEMLEALETHPNPYQVLLGMQHPDFKVSRASFYTVLGEQQLRLSTPKASPKSPNATRYSKDSEDIESGEQNQSPPSSSLSPQPTGTPIRDYLTNMGTIFWARATKTVDTILSPKEDEKPCEDNNASTDPYDVYNSLV